MAKILVIDDDEDLVNMLTMRLQANKHVVISANDALYGTTKAHEERPDLIILDLRMPLGGGQQTFQNLKKSSHTSEIPVIILSGTADEEMKDSLHEMGIAGFVEKPFESEDLVKTIELVLQKEEG